MKENL